MDEAIKADAASDQDVAHSYVHIPLLLAEIHAAAKMRGLTRSAFLASAAREKIAAIP